MFVPDSKSNVAKVCLRTWGVTFLFIPAAFVNIGRIFCGSFEVIGFPEDFMNKYSESILRLLKFSLMP